MSGFALPALLGNIIGGSVLFAMMAYAQVRQEIEADPTTPRPARKQGPHKESLP